MEAVSFVKSDSDMLEAKYKELKATTSLAFTITDLSFNAEYGESPNLKQSMRILTTISAGTVYYRFDLDKMKQTNTESKTVRNIRRLAPAAEGNTRI